LEEVWRYVAQPAARHPDAAQILSGYNNERVAREAFDVALGMGPTVDDIHVSEVAWLAKNPSAIGSRKATEKTLDL
jgi:hypothetical protein